MTILITELAIQADGTYAIELTNTDGSNAVDISTWALVFGTESSGLTNKILTDFGLPSSIPAGATITFGHSSIAGLDHSATATDPWFAFAGFDLLAYGPTVPSFTFVDSIGVMSGPAFEADTVYSSSTARTPDTDPFSGNNIGDFTRTSSFATNTLSICFAEGTLIATPEGERRVETLCIGDAVLTSDGRTVPVLWLGRQTVRRRIGRVAEKLTPVRIRAGALGGGLPHSDLTVTADHGMVLDGHVINASALVNGDGIDWVPEAELPARFTVYHVETEAHDVILANGAPSETFIDYRDRRAFDNFDEYLDLYGAERIIPEMPHPRISSARQLPEALRARLGADPGRDLAESA